MVSIIKNIYNINTILILLFRKNVKNSFVWEKERFPDLKFFEEQPKPWLKLDAKSAKDNERAEEKAEPKDDDIELRALKDTKRIDISPKDCGQSWNTRIVGGSVAPYGTYPWVVVIVRYNVPICAGNIIHPKWVITAAHCFMKNNSTEGLFIRIGTNLSNKGTRIQAERIIVHPRFHIDKMYNSDISLIKTSKTIYRSKNVGVICLPQFTYSEPMDKYVMVAGWGAKTFVSMDMPIQLHEIKLPIISVKQCSEKYSTKKVTTYKSQFCTWSKGKDACKGDSGGPAVQYDKGRAYLVGIVSYGITCADQFPGIFTKTSYFLQWIKYTIEKYTYNKNPEYDYYDLNNKNDQGNNGHITVVDGKEKEKKYLSEAEYKSLKLKLIRLKEYISEILGDLPD